MEESPDVVVVPPEDVELVLVERLLGTGTRRWLTVAFIAVLG